MPSAELALEYRVLRQYWHAEGLLSVRQRPGVLTMKQYLAGCGVSAFVLTLATSCASTPQASSGPAGGLVAHPTAACRAIDSRQLTDLVSGAELVVEADVRRSGPDSTLAGYTDFTLANIKVLGSVHPLSATLMSAAVIEPTPPSDAAFPAGRYVLFLLPTADGKAYFVENGLTGAFRVHDNTLRRQCPNVAEPAVPLEAPASTLTLGDVEDQVPRALPGPAVRTQSTVSVGPRQLPTEASPTGVSATMAGWHA
jgi:hypothetical protein